MKGLEFISGTFISDAETELIGKHLDNYWDSEEEVVHNEIITGDKMVDEENRAAESFAERFKRKYERRRISPLFQLIVFIFIMFLLSVTVFAVDQFEMSYGIKAVIKGTLLIGIFIMSICLLIHMMLKKPYASNEPLLKEWRKAQDRLYKEVYGNI